MACSSPASVFKLLFFLLQSPHRRSEDLPPAFLRRIEPAACARSAATKDILLCLGLKRGIRRLEAFAREMVRARRLSTLKFRNLSVESRIELFELAYMCPSARKVMDD